MKPYIKILSFLALLTSLFQACGPSKTQPCSDLSAFITQLGNNVLKVEAGWGTIPYSYNWSNGVTLGETTVSTSGVYSVTVTDAKGCTATSSFNYTYTAGCTPSTVNDADGNIYDVVSIGSQCWMQQNLRVGTNVGVPEVSDSLMWTNLTTPGWCNYENKPANEATYGRLYNWAAVKTGNLCPAGWHIATVDDWNLLITNLGGPNIAGGKMKDSSLLWYPPNTGASSSSLFKAKPSGYRGGGTFWDQLKSAAFWTATSYLSDTTQAWALTLNYQYALAAIGFTPKYYGYSCRCVRD